MKKTSLYEEIKETKALVKQNPEQAVMKLKVMFSTIDNHSDLKHALFSFPRLFSELDKASKYLAADATAAALKACERFPSLTNGILGDLVSAIPGEQIGKHPVAHKMIDACTGAIDRLKMKNDINCLLLRYELEEKLRLMRKALGAELPSGPRVKHGPNFFRDPVYRYQP